MNVNLCKSLKYIFNYSYITNILYIIYRKQLKYINY